MFEKDLRSILDSIASEVQEKRLKSEEYKRLKNEYNTVGRPSKFIRSLQSDTNDTYEICLLILKLTKYPELHMPLVNGTFQKYIRRYIDKHEGMSCAGDKTSFIFAQVIKHLQTGKVQSLYVTYSGDERIEKEDWNKQTYWSPTSFNTTDDVLKHFADWYVRVWELNN